MRVGRAVIRGKSRAVLYTDHLALNTSSVKRRYIQRIVGRNGGLLSPPLDRATMNNIFIAL
jgi:hypothetical protein